jgi:hypothetical protein
MSQYGYFCLFQRHVFVMKKSIRRHGYSPLPFNRKLDIIITLEFELYKKDDSL